MRHFFPHYRLYLTARQKKKEEIVTFRKRSRSPQKKLTVIPMKIILPERFGWVMFLPSVYEIRLLYYYRYLFIELKLSETIIMDESMSSIYLIISKRQTKIHFLSKFIARIINFHNITVSHAASSKQFSIFVSIIYF